MATSENDTIMMISSTLEDQQLTSEMLKKTSLPLKVDTSALPMQSNSANSQITPTSNSSSTLSAVPTPATSPAGSISSRQVGNSGGKTGAKVTK